MPGLLKVLDIEELLKRRLFQVNFHVTLGGDGLVTLLYHTPFARAERRDRERRQRETHAAEAPPLPDGEVDVLEGPLTDEWELAAQRLSVALGGVSVVGHSRGRKRVVGRDWVLEELQVPGSLEPIRLRQLEGMFSQPNSHVAQHMVAWSRAVAFAEDAVVGASLDGVSPRQDDLLELYCGNGNFAVSLARCFRRVLATELVKALVDAAKENAQANGVSDKLAVARVSSEELAQAMDGTRSFQRLAHVNLDDYDFQTVLVDPPRAGLGSEVAKFLTRFPRIVYISCNPKTLREDFESLRATHEIRRIAAFDQFPYTDHLEMGALLVRRQL